VLLATHSADEVLELCNRVAVLDRGRLLATGTTTSLARDLGEERYALFTRDASHPALAAMVQRGVVGALNVRGDEDGWTRVDMEVIGGMERAAQIVATLVEQGVVVARFEKVPLPLADLIDRIVRRGAEEKSNA
jgi:ABC-type multidrug transport system ATPase subunit